MRRSLLRHALDTTATTRDCYKHYYNYNHFRRLVQPARVNSLIQMLELSYTTTATRIPLQLQQLLGDMAEMMNFIVAAEETIFTNTHA